MVDGGEAVHKDRLPRRRLVSGSGNAVAGRLPAWWLLAVVAAAGAIVTTKGPLVDIDVWWHIRVGDYFLHGHAFPSSHDPWSYTVPTHHWHSTSYLSELTLAAINDVAGMAGMIALRVVLFLLIAYALFRQLVAPSKGWSGPLVYVIVMLPLAAYIQERPQTVSFLFLIWLASRAMTVLDDGAPPRRWTFVLMTYVWATIHGLFVLAPVTLALLALGRVLDHGHRDRKARELLTTAVIATVACALTPMGPRLLLSPITVSSAAKGYVVEWAPTTLTTFGAWGLFALTGLLLVISIRSTQSGTRGEALYLLAFVVFGLMAIRNASSASLMLAPLAVRRLDATYPTSSDLTLPARPLRALSALLLVAASLSYLGEPVLDHPPDGIAHYLAASPTPLKVLNDYNVSGYLIYHDGSHVRLVIDGRADRYGHAFIEKYRLATQGDPSWKSFVAATDPDVAVLVDNAPLDGLLVDAGWTKVMKEDGYVVLRKPAT